MIQRITEAISTVLYSLYPDYPILDTLTEQAITLPAFFITCYHSFITERIQPAGFFKRYDFEIKFDPGEINPDLLCREVEDTLTIALRRIPDPESEYAFRPVNLEFRTVDGLLNILIDFIVELKVLGPELPDIEKATISTGVN